jgi:hypothetical protein
MLARAMFWFALAACPVLADSPTTQPSRSAGDVVTEMRAIERRVETDLSRSGDYAALKARQAELGKRLDTCEDKDRSELAAERFAITQQISAMEKTELTKDGQYSALHDEYDRLALGIVRRPKDVQPTTAPAPVRSSNEAPTSYRASDRYRYARLKIGAHKSSLIGVQTFTFQQ